MAPSDAELMGDARPVQKEGDGVDPNSEAGAGGNISAIPSSGGSSELPGPSGDAAGVPSGGETTVPAGGAGGEGSESGADTDFSSLIPQDGLELWLMADHGVAVLDGGYVAQWADFSINERDAYQSSAALQPTLLPAADGSPAIVEFDGTDDQLAFLDGFSDFSAGLTAFVIAKATTDTNCQALLHFSNGEESDDIQIGRHMGSIHYEVGTPSLIGPENAFTLGQRMLVGVGHTPDKKAELRLNGLVMSSGTLELPAVTERTTNFVGRSMYGDCQPFQGQIGEIILYSRVLDAGERSSVQSYLQGKWSYEPPVKTKPGPGEIPAAE